MFPIFNLTGEVIAFGGRTLGDDRAEVSQHEEHAGVHEGSARVWTAARAASGRSSRKRSSSSKVTRLPRCCIKPALAMPVRQHRDRIHPGTSARIAPRGGKLYLCFDGDAAGQAATTRSIDMLVDEGLQCPRRHAADRPRSRRDHAARRGADAFAIARSPSRAWMRLQNRLACKQIASAFSNKSDIARQAMTVIANVRDPIERDQYIKTMSRKLDVSEARCVRCASSGRRTARTPGDGIIADSPAHAGAAPDSPYERELYSSCWCNPRCCVHAAHRS